MLAIRDKMIQSALIGLMAASCCGQDSTVDLQAILDSLTLEQKLGQLTLIPIGEPSNLPEQQLQQTIEAWRDDARSGAIGCMYGPKGAEYTNLIQRAAFEESEHGIPLIMGNDIIHGYRTIFPIPLASSGSFNLELLESLTRAAAVEARAAGTHWTFAPMVDISRDPRLGRVAEGAGEDPFYGAAVAVARVRGFQGERLDAGDAVARRPCTLLPRSVPPSAA
jgi:beta-glucosidase